MLGIVGEHTAADWESDFANALEYGVSAFALNFGPNDGSTDTQLQLAYAAAEKVGFKLFLSFDFNSGYYTAGDVQKVADRIKPYANHPAQYIVDGKPLVSSFLGEDMDWSAVADAVGMPIFASPMSTNPNGGTLQSKGASGLLSWNAWASQNNQPINAVITLATDKPFFSAAESANLDYIMPVSPWFFTHYGKDVPYSKNFLFKSEDQWLTRWNEILTSEPRARFLEILTWNDFGESSYLVDPAAVQAADDGHSRWTKGFSHADLMVMAKPFISAFKTGATAPVVETEGAVYWYRPHLKSAECDSTDNYGSKPTGWELVDDTVFVAVITKNGGTLTVTSGGNAPVTEKVEAGVQMVKVPMGAGAQTFQLKTTDGASLSGKGVHDISADCIDGQYNYNINVGSLA
jgi:hypothetical protein